MFSFARSKATLKSAWLEMSISTNMIAEADQPEVQAPLLDPCVAGHAERDQRATSG